MKRKIFVIVGLNIFIYVTLRFSSLACAEGPSFSCEKANTRVEKMICADSELSKLDRKLDMVFYEGLSRFPDMKSSIKQDQRKWLEFRNKCISDPRPNLCLNTKYESRISELDPLQTEYKLPIRIEDLGENWQYTNDSEKLAVIRDAMASGRLKPPPPDYNKDCLCETFPSDLVAGRNIEVIEPEMQVLNRDDPRLGKPLITDIGGKGVRRLSRDDPSLGRWYRCDSINSDESSAKNPWDVFTWFMSVGLRPYRFYRIELDGNTENGPEDVLLFRLPINGFSHKYNWIDLNGCEIMAKIQINSPANSIHTENRDALSLIIRYHGQVLVLRYMNWAKKESHKHEEKIAFNSLALPKKGCQWGDPFGNLWKTYRNSERTSK